MVGLGLLSVFIYCPCGALLMKIILWYVILWFVSCFLQHVWGLSKSAIVSVSISLDLVAKGYSGLWVYHICTPSTLMDIWVIPGSVYCEEWCCEHWCIRLYTFWSPHVFSWMLNCWPVITLCLTFWEIVKWVTEVLFITAFSTPLLAPAVMAWCSFPKWLETLTSPRGFVAGSVFFGGE